MYELERTISNTIKSINRVTCLSTLYVSCVDCVLDISVHAQGPFFLRVSDGKDLRLLRVA